MSNLAHSFLLAYNYRRTVEHNRMDTLHLNYPELNLNNSSKPLNNRSPPTKRKRLHLITKDYSNLEKLEPITKHSEFDTLGDGKQLQSQLTSFRSIFVVNQF